MMANLTKLSGSGRIFTREDIGRDVAKAVKLPPLPIYPLGSSFWETRRGGLPPSQRTLPGRMSNVAASSGDNVSPVRVNIHPDGR